MRGNLTLVRTLPRTERLLSADTGVYKTAGPPAAGQREKATHGGGASERLHPKAAAATPAAGRTQDTGGSATCEVAPGDVGPADGGRTSAAGVKDGSGIPSRVQACGPDELEGAWTEGSA